MDLAKLETYKESNRLDAKAAQGGLPKSVWVTVGSGHLHCRLTFSRNACVA